MRRTPICFPSAAATPRWCRRCARATGWKAPPGARLWLYLTSLARLDLGWSVIFNRAISDLILERLPNTLWLMGSAGALSFTVGSALGIVAGSKPGSWRDRLLSTGSLALYAVPSFWLGLVLIVVFSVQLRWFPTSGIETIASGRQGLARASDIAWHLALPVAALGLIYLALFLRMMRAGMAEAWRHDYALAARARGLGHRRIAFFHIARNALLPLVTMLGLQAASMLGGSVVIESVFAIPGFGRLAQEAVAGRDAAAAHRHYSGQRRAGHPRQSSRRHGLCVSRPACRRERGGGMNAPMNAPISAPGRLLRSPAGVAGLALLALLALAALGAPFLFPGDPLAIAGPPLTPPFTDPAFPLGTDRLGRDVLAGLFHGAQASLAVGLAAAAVSIVAGALVGTIAGFAGGLADEALMRVVDAFQTVPGFLLALAFVSVAGASLPVVILAIALGAWTGPARLARAEVLSIRERDYVAAARVIGMHPAEIALREVLPNALPPVIVYASVVMAVAILLESALAFLRLSDPNVASWGNLIGLGRDVLRSEWYVSAIPGLAILVTVLAV